MSAEVLRQAAARIHHDVEYGQAHGDDRFLLAVADWLDAEASNRDAGIGGRGWFSVGGQADALAVARAYLGSDA